MARRLAWAAGGLLALLLLSAAVLWLAWRSDAGLDWVLSRVPGLQIEGRQGRPDGGPFRAARLVWAGGGTRVEIDELSWRDLRWQWRPHAGAWIGLAIERPEARRVQVHTTPAPARAQPAARTPPDLWLPLQLRVDGLAVQWLQVDALPPVQALGADLLLGDELGAAHRLERLQLQVAGVQLQADGRIASSGDQALRLQLQARPLAGAAHPWQLDAQAEGRLAAPDLQATLQAAEGARARLQAGLAPFAAWPLRSLSATLQALDLSALAPALPRTALSGEARVQADSAQAPLGVDLSLANAEPGRWDEGRLPLRTLQAHVQGRWQDRRSIDLSHLVAQTTGGAVQAQGRWTGDTLALDLGLQALRPARLDARAPAMTLDGPLLLQLQGLPAPDGTAASRPLAGQADVDLRGRLDAVRRAVSIAGEAQFSAPAGGPLVFALPRLALASGAARAQLSGRAARDAGQAWAVDANALVERFDPSLWWPGREGAWRRGPHALNGRLGAALSLVPGRMPRGHAQLQLADSVLAGVPLAGRAAWRDDGLTQAEADLRAAGNRLQLDARWRGREVQAAHLDLQAPALAALGRWAALLAPSVAAWWPTAGRVQARADLDGRWPDLRTEALLQADGVAAGERRLDRLEARLEGRLPAHRFSLQAASPLRPPAWVDAQPGGTTLDLQGSGGWQAAAAGGGAWQVRVQTLQLSPRREGAAPWVAAQGLTGRVEIAPAGGVAAAALAPGRVELLGAALAWTQARWQPGTVALDATLAPLAVSPWLARFMPQAGWAGDLRVEGRARVQRGQQGAALQADVVLQRTGGDLSIVQGNRRQALGLTALRVALEVAQGRWQLTQALTGTQIGVLAGSQTLRAAPADLLPAPASPLEGVITLQTPDLDVWSPWLPAGWQLGGDLRATALLGGTAGTPTWTGRVDGNALAVGNLLEGVELRDGTLAVALTGDEARIEQFRFRGGEGTLAASGGARFGASPSARVQLQADRLQVLGRIDRRIVASGRADVALGAEGVAVNGRFRVDEGLVDVTRSEAAALDGDVIVVNRPGVPKAAPAATRPLSARLSLDLDLGEQLRLRGRGLDTRLAGLLHVSTPEGRLAVDGTVRTVGGTYAAYGQNLEIERGLITFQGELASPTLDILAVRPDIDQRVGVSIIGTALNPRVRLYSEPEMSELDKISWLVLGRASTGLGTADTALLQRAALALLAGDKGGSGGVVQRLGLDELSIGQSGEGETRQTVVTLGKQINRRLFIGYERGLNAAAGSWQLIYRIARRFTLRASSGEESALDLIWSWSWN